MESIAHVIQTFSLWQGKESGVKMTETGGAVVCAVAQLFKGASGVAFALAVGWT